MATRKIETETERDDLAESGEIGWGTLVRDSSGLAWLAYDTEDGPHAVRPLNEDDDPERRTPFDAELADLPLPLYVTTEEK